MALRAAGLSLGVSRYLSGAGNGNWSRLGGSLQQELQPFCAAGESSAHHGGCAEGASLTDAAWTSSASHGPHPPHADTLMLGAGVQGTSRTTRRRGRSRYARWPWGHGVVGHRAVHASGCALRMIAGSAPTCVHWQHGLFQSVVQATQSMNGFVVGHAALQSGTAQRSLHGAKASSAPHAR